MHHPGLLCPPQGAHGADCFAVSMHGVTCGAEQRKHRRCIWLTVTRHYWDTGRRVITLPECTAPGVWLPLHTFSVQLVFLQEKVEFQLFRTSWILCQKMKKYRKIPLTETLSVCSYMYSIAKLQLQFKKDTIKNIKGMKNFNHIKWQKKQILEYPALEDKTPSELSGPS